MENIPVIYFYFIWFLGGFGLAFFISRFKRFRPLPPNLLLAVTVIIAMLLVTLGIRVVWRYGITEIGWGFYSYPPCLAGILIFFGWVRGYRAGFLVTTVLNLVVGLIAIFSFLASMDTFSYGIAYWDVNAKYDPANALRQMLQIVDARIDSILLYLASTIISQAVLFLILPWTDSLVKKGWSAFSKTAKNYSKT